jgi:hypothetical protein
MTTQKCPNCGAPMTGEAGFGMVICNSCGDLVMMNGAEVQEEKPKVEVITENLIEDLPPLIQELPSEVTNPETFEDVVEFGNQELPSQGSGGLVYDLDIEGIDTAENRKQLLDAISDSRLGLDSKALIETIDKGSLKIPELNPVKAAVILARLRPFSFQIRWSSKQLVKAAAAFIVVLGLGRMAESDDWSKHEANLNNYAGRINSMQEEIHDLIVKKNQNKDPSKRDAMLDEIKKKDETLKTLYKSYHDEKDQILYEHPEQGDTSERKYRHVKMKTLEEMESEPGVDGQLTRLKAKVDETYPEKKSN